MLNYTVNFWGSDPDAENDDCWYDENFATLDEAMAKFHAVVFDRDVAFVEIDGPGIYAKRKNPNFRPSRDDGEWQREIAMQAGMEGGCDAYNEAMGWD